MTVPPPDTAQGRYQITLVHGTFGKGTAWTQEGSGLRQKLSESLRDACLNVFEWSGRNTHRARLEAGRELAEFLDAIALRDPHARQVVITHSHGGNVALYAGRHIKNRQGLARIVFLATPFIVCRALKGRLGYLSIRVLVSVVLASVLSGFLIRSVTPKPPEAHEDYWLNLSPEDKGYYELVEAIQGIALAMIFVVAFLLATAYVRRMTARQLARLRWPRLDELSFLSVCYKVDEAAIYLSHLNLATTRLSRLIWKVLDWGARGLVALFALVFLMGLIAVAKLYIAPEWLLPKWFALAMPRAGVIEWAVAGYAVLFAVLATVAYLLAMLRGNPLGYGWERPSATNFLDIEALVRPEGLQTAEAEFADLDIGEFGRDKFMAHTSIYDDPRVHQKIVDWIVGQNALQAKP
ncbi:MAG: esterase/lipase family protein [Hyphomicrobiaceae bacterium]